MQLEKAILHILDKDVDTLICSQNELDLKDVLTQEYVRKLVNKLDAADLKEGHLAVDNDFKKIFEADSLSFVEQSSEIAKMLYDVAVRGEEVPGGDLLVATVRDDENHSLLAIIKLNYAQKYTHLVDYDDAAVLTNKVILNRSILPSATQRVDEAVFINLSDYSYRLTEKKYLYEGKKVNYFSEHFLKTTALPTVTENIRTIKKAVKKVAEKYNEEKYVSLSNAQNAVYESVEAEGNISIEHIAETVFEENPVAKAEYLNIVKESGVSEKITLNNTPKYEKKYSKQKFKLDNGIELIIPVDVYKDKDLIEFVNNPDGTTSVLIKNVDEIMNKF